MKEIGKKKKESKGEDKCEEEIVKKTEFESKIPELLKTAEELERVRDVELIKIGNLVTDEVPIFDNEDNNLTTATVMNNKPSEYILKVMEEEGCSCPLGFTESLLTTKTNGTAGFLEHWEIMHAIDGLDLERGRKVSGHRG